MENQFGKYTLLKKLGDGGMAEVFLAEMKGPEGFSKRVAIKRILPHLSHDSVFTESFINEARLGGYLNHHNIVQTLDFGQIDGFYYLAMEYVQGVDLRQVLQLAQQENEALPLGIALDIAYQICEGLVYAHSATDGDRRPLRMIHRDLKPSNILINGHGVVKIADFGVARAESNIAHTQMASGNPKGTVAYMSPEQAMGSLDLDQRADIFSLGSIFFELASNERLYTATTYLGALRQAQDGEIGDRLNMVGSMPGRELIVPILDRALAPDRGERYANSRAFSKDLRRALMSAETDFTLGDYIRDFDRRQAQVEARAKRPAAAQSVAPAQRPSQSQAPSHARPPSRPPASQASAQIPAAPSVGAGYGGMGGATGAAVTVDEVFTEMRPAFEPVSAPTATHPSHSGAGPARRPGPTTSAGRRIPPPAEAPREELSAQTLRPREKKKGRLGGVMMAAATAALLILIGAVVTLAVMGRPSKVVIETDPAGATLTLPGGQQVTAPHEVRVPSDGMRVAVSQKGYEPKELPIPGGAPDGQIWRVKLQALPANLQVVVSPVEAKLTINGLPVPGSSPYRLPDVASAERLDLAVTLEGYETLTRAVTLEPGTDSTETFELKLLPPPEPAPKVTEAQPPAPGTDGGQPKTQPAPAASEGDGYLMCNALPKGGGSMWARVFIDGKYVGNTPMVKQKVAVGAHDVLLVAEDGRQQQRSVTIDKGKTSRLLVEFD